MKITCGSKEIEKPAAVIDYNNHKAYRRLRATVGHPKKKQN
jgi:hypothetical protein